eukprot:scaffold42887_cov24-Phaeocystis_antarctica.AAC.1
MPSGMEKPARRWLAAARCAVPQVHVVYAPAAPANVIGPEAFTREAPRGGSGVHTPSVHRQPTCPWVWCVLARRPLGAAFSLFAAPPGAERPRPGCRLGRSTEVPCSFSHRTGPTHAPLPT